MSKKKSEFIAIETVPDDYSFNVFGNNVDREITKPDLFAQIKGEIFSPFIYPTIELLQDADLEADQDNPTYVRCEETEYMLYKITNFAVGVNDIALDNGNTATYQLEYRDVGFVVGPAVSVAGSLAIFTDTGGAQLDDLLVPTNAGKAFMQAADSASVTFPRKNADNTVSMLGASTYFDAIKQLSAVGYAGAIKTADNTAALAQIANDMAITPANLASLKASNAETLAGTDDTKYITSEKLQVKMADKPTVIATFADLASTPVVAGKVYYLKEYHAGTGIGGGPIKAFAGSITPDNGLTFNCTTGFYVERINYSIPDATMYGIRPDGTLSNTELQSAVTALAGKSLYFPDGEYNFSVFPSGIDAVRMEGSSRIVWTDKKMPIFNGVFTGGLETALVSGCIRYYAASGGDAAGWYFLVDKGEDHDPILTGPITASGHFAQFLSINFSDFGLDPTLWTPSGVVVGADDTLAKEGITVGASVGDTQIEIYGSFNACSNTVVRYNDTPGSGWTYEGASGGLATYTFSWVDNSLATAHLRITRTGGARAFRPASYLGSDFRLTPKVKTTGDVVNIPPYIPYISTQGVDGSGDTYVDVVFYDPVANTRLTILNEYVVFLMEDYGAVNTQLRWQDIDNAHGNIWFVGAFVRKPSSL